MVKYLKNKIGQVAELESPKLIEQYLNEVVQVGTEMLEIDGTMVEQPIYEKVWEELPEEVANPKPTQEQIDKEEQDRLKYERIAELENEMRELSYDFDQDKAGIYQPNLEEKKALYRQDYNELCQLKGVVPKQLK